LSWSGTIVRTEGAIDASSQQLHVVAQVNDPFSTERGTRPIKIGEYVTAVIDGRLLTDRLVIPSDAIYQNSYVYVVEEGLLRRRDVTVAWQNGIDAIIKDGLLAGEELVTTPLGQVTSGTRVRVALPSGTGEGEAAIRRPHGDWHKASSIPQGGRP
jgi:multidrug efflux pump subunit AcrA (membrane-fusion protein)